MKDGLSYNDVLLVPQYSNLSSRSEVDLSVELFDRKLRLPILSSPMDTVTGIEMQKAMEDAGCLGIHHRYCDKDILLKASLFGPIAVSPSLGTGFIDNLLFDMLDKPIVVLDVAHGDSKVCYEYAKYCLDKGCIVVSGNICTPEAARRYIDLGITYLRVGVGPGSACTTRKVAGIGYPQLSAILEINDYLAKNDLEATIIADGGIKESGDIVKALAFGASAVILGRLLAGANEAPGERRQVWLQPENVVPKTDSDSARKFCMKEDQKQYRGMSSHEALSEAGKEHNIEGTSTWVKEEGPVADILDRLERGMRAGLAYCGARNIQELREKAEWVKV